MELTELRVKEIAREEMQIYVKQLSEDVSSIREGQRRIERLLEGEAGGFAEENLKAKADFAYRYAKKSTDLLLPERLEKELKWYENMSSVDEGEPESKLVTLGKMITYYRNVKWLLGIIGISTVINSIPVIILVGKWILGLVK